ncbi:alcohol dehydrogenase catalytic domain-containing protein [Paenibacillus sp. MWE-103]|uniref:Alcohol dehydrogenase catalytic domain-containing protein n=1 Tax=Paenibacillus artemisiicola TaxID=1172618 RepID=A0ABS3W5V5_9BACL|nr:alcohol dehydrogenase catalytic domain-containing protein [Paenibacillus artemisiicola]MBO7743697.1 alcohol dehydrogenase catalytic domain-containing protein [Paenibacillus artemisiicola]
MEALVWIEDGTIRFDADWPKPALLDDEVLVEIRAEGVCMTDIHMVRGTLDFAKPPWVLGHEMSGVIAETGPKVTGWLAGERVVVDPVVTCGHCRPCLSGKKYLCASGGELGTTFGSGGYGRYVAVKPSNLYRLPDALTFEEGAMMEPLNCTLGAMERVPRVAGNKVIVFGPGPAGLLFLQLAKAYGALSVTLVGMSDERLALGKRLGADRTINLASSSLREVLGEETFDIAIEASGSVEAVTDSFEYVGKGGTIVLYGLNGSKKPTIESDLIVSKDLTLVTCISAPLLWNKGMDLVEAGKVNVRDIITHRLSFEEAAASLNRLVADRFHPIKAMILHQDEETKR